MKLWTPSKDHIENCNLKKFNPFNSYQELYQWSIDAPEEFWPAVWKFCNIKSSRYSDKIIINKNNMRESIWFEGTQLNFAQNLLSRQDDKLAIVFRNEKGERRTLTYKELYQAVACYAQELKNLGVIVGDRVAGVLPNCPETIIAMLATTSIGAIWSSCSPDFGVHAVVDRFAQIEPKVLFATRSHEYNGKYFEDKEKIELIADQLPSLKKVVFLDPANKSRDDKIEFAQLPFDHPIYILYSSGTTGVPKCITHGAGGTLLQHLKELVLHVDLKPEDTIFYYTTCGWMMWNWVVSSLAVGSALVLYDGAPMYPKPSQLFDLINEEKITIFGTSAKYLSAVEKANIDFPNVDSLKTILSTGSPLLPEQFDFVYSKIKKDVCLSSISGGTDIVSCFALGNPILPVYKGELQCIGLGMKVEVFNDKGQPVKNQKGELVCTQAFPSMPIYFWNDPTGEKYKKAYFEKFPGMWAHGDYAEITEHNGLIIYGRSDAVLNPGGIRIGTAEIYREVEKMPEILESICVEKEEEGIILFVKLAENINLDDLLIIKIKNNIKNNLSPHHVPKRIIAVSDIPKTVSGKIVELAVREVVHGREVKNIDAIANPEALKYFKM